MTGIVVTLPWPDKRLSPNAREHWGSKASAVKAARLLAWGETMRIGRTSIAPPLDVRVTWHAPDRRARDQDNVIASLKSYQDGIAQALGIDDRHFRPHYNDGPIIKGGAVVFQIQEASK